VTGTTRVFATTKLLERGDDVNEMEWLQNMIERLEQEQEHQRYSQVYAKAAEELAGQMVKNFRERLETLQQEDD